MRIYQQLKNVYHFFQSLFWRAYYGWPDRGMKIYGVTGTNGKTTTCILLGNILREAHRQDKVGLLTTIIFWIGAREIINKTKMTTMDSRQVWQYIRQMKDAGVEHLVLEVTSHALDQHRLAGVKLNGAILTNIAREHLDYHGTMHEYSKAKSKIISYLKASAPLVVKGDDEWIKRALSKTQSTDMHNPPAGGPNKTQNTKTEIIEFTTEQARQVITSLLGEVNKENVLAATLLARAIGVDEKIIARGVAKVEHVPGRMEWVTIEQRAKSKEKKIPKVLIDYAVTPDALERLYREIKAQTTGKIFAVLGACGNRDRGKRPDMARVVAKYADELVLTREDPWTENEEQIFQDLEKGLKNTTRHWSRIIDRRAAIQYCLQKADSQDVVVVTGKGAEEGMAVGKTIIPWSDKQVILELLTNLANAKSNDQ